MGLTPVRRETDLRGVMLRLRRAAESSDDLDVYHDFISEVIGPAVFGVDAGYYGAGWMPPAGVKPPEQAILPWLFAQLREVHGSKDWNKRVLSSARVVDWARETGADFSSLSWSQAERASRAWWQADPSERLGEKKTWRWPDGWHLVELEDPRDVVAESVVMNNCLDLPVYRRRAAHSGFLLLSLRRPSGRPAATIEMRWQGHDWMLIPWNQALYDKVAMANRNLWVPIQVQLTANELPIPGTKHYLKLQRALRELQPDLAWWGGQALGTLSMAELELLYTGKLRTWGATMRPDERELQQQGACKALWFRHYCKVGSKVYWQNDALPLTAGGLCMGFCVHGQDGGLTRYLTVEYLVETPGKHWSQRRLKVILRIVEQQQRSKQVIAEHHIAMSADETQPLPEAIGAAELSVLNAVGPSGVKSAMGDWIVMWDQVGLRASSEHALKAARETLMFHGGSRC